MSSSHAEKRTAAPWPLVSKRPEGTAAWSSSHRSTSLLASHGPLQTPLSRAGQIKGNLQDSASSTDWHTALFLMSMVSQVCPGRQLSKGRVVGGRSASSPHQPYLELARIEEEAKKKKKTGYHLQQRIKVKSNERRVDLGGGGGSIGDCSDEQATNATAQKQPKLVP